MQHQDFLEQGSNDTKCHYNKEVCSMCVHSNPLTARYQFLHSEIHFIFGTAFLQKQKQMACKVKTCTSILYWDYTVASFDDSPQIFWLGGGNLLVNIQSPLCIRTKDDGQQGYLPRFSSLLQWRTESFIRLNPKSEVTSVNAIISGHKEKGGQRTKIKGTRLFFNK